MYCPHCGALLQEGAAFCGSCGAKQADAPVAQPVRSYAEDPAPAAPQPYKEYTAPDAAQTPVYAENFETAADPQAQYKLRWFQFLIYFSLFAAALLQIINAVRLFAGLEYLSNDIDPQQIYALYGGLKTVDMLFGCLFVVDAVFIIVARFQLAKFKKNGPLFLYLCSIFAIILSCGYTLMSYSATGVDIWTAEGIGYLIGQALPTFVLLIINIVYFSKRKPLFVN